MSQSAARSLRRSIRHGGVRAEIPARRAFGRAVAIVQARILPRSADARARLARPPKDLGVRDHAGRRHGDGLDEMRLAHAVARRERVADRHVREDEAGGWLRSDAFPA